MARLNESNYLITVNWNVICPLDLGDASVRLNSAVKRFEHARTQRVRAVNGGVVIGSVNYRMTEHYYGDGRFTVLRLTGTIVEHSDGCDLQLLASPNMFSGAFVALFIAGAIYTSVSHPSWSAWFIAALVFAAWSWGFQSAARELRGYLSNGFNADINPK